jgi:hypothetical protein
MSIDKKGKTNSFVITLPDLNVSESG